jgi:hypothetical protein
MGVADLEVFERELNDQVPVLAVHPVVPSGGSPEETSGLEREERAGSDTAAEYNRAWKRAAT